MKTKRVTEDFGDCNIMQQWTSMDIAIIMEEIEKFERCVRVCRINFYQKKYEALETFYGWVD